MRKGKRGSGEWGMGSGEWGGTRALTVRHISFPHSPFPTPHSPFPIPHSPFRIRLEFMKIDHATVAVVTGAASGIGRALAVRLAQEGASLALADINAAELNETARRLKSIGGSTSKVTEHIVDVSDKERVAAFAREVVEAHGGAHLLIKNAGVGLFGTAEQLSIEDIEWLMGVNFWGVVYGVKHFLPILRRQSEGHIVNVSSVFGIVAPVGHSAYVASKFVVRGVLRNEERILVGVDAWMIDRIQRWAPVKYWRLMGKMIEILTK